MRDIEAETTAIMFRVNDDGVDDDDDGGASSPVEFREAGKNQTQKYPVQLTHMASSHVLPLKPGMSPSPPSYPSRILATFNTFNLLHPRCDSVR